MSEIIFPSDFNLYDFNKIIMLSPISVLGGNHFIKFRKNESAIYIQTPTCKAKQGFIKSGKKMYCDLMFTNENEDFIRWMENLEKYCQKMIYENRTKWFETDLDECDIENSFTSPLKIFKSGKYYICRINVPTIMGTCNLKIYDENETTVQVDSIQENTNVVAILEIQGIKCSARNFQIEIEVKQMMKLEPKQMFEKCILKKTTNNKEVILEQDDPNEVSLAKPPPISSLASTSVDPISIAPTSVAPTSVAPEAEPVLEDAFTETADAEPTPSIIQMSTIENEPGILEIEFDLEKMSEQDTINIKQRNDIYYKLYKDAKQKAKLARDLALSSYLEAKRIKQTYLFDNMEDSESDLDENTFENI